jgi:hypothetical protein
MGGRRRLERLFVIGVVAETAYTGLRSGGAPLRERGCEPVVMQPPDSCASAPD